MSVDTQPSESKTHPLLRQLREVVLSYLAEMGWHNLWFGPVVLILFSFIYSHTDTESRNGFIPSFAIIVSVGLTAAVFGRAERMYFGNYSARLIPNYSAPHLLFLSIILFLGVIAHPFLYATLSGNSRVGMIALSSLACLVLLYSNERFSYLSAPLTVLVLTVFDSELGKDLFFNVGQNFWLRIFLLMFGSFGLVHRTNQLTVSYERTYESELSLKDPGTWTPAEERKHLGQLAARSGLTRVLSDRWHDRLPCENNSRRARLNLLQYGTDRLPFSAYVIAVCLVGTFLLAVWKGLGQQVAPETLVGGLWLVTLLPIAGVAQLSSRADYIARELLLPMTRRELVDNLIWITVRQSFWVWLCGIGLLAGAVLMAPPFLLEKPLETCLAATSLSLVMQPPIIGLTLSLALVKLQLVWVTCIGMLALTSLTFVLGWASEASGGDNWQVVSLIAITTIPLGWAFFVNARSQWLNAEFG